MKHRWVESTEGPPRKYYQLTDEGKTMLDQLKQAWDDISKTVTQILND
ncbi:MAG: PadR family transcriptional regulator [Sphingobacteriales bacterium JAD_PAG50586_3]|nr:MAG: PadR family transcriptional regulator [Sphingobacteriales bacterium JAD_PAG50586_3]